MCVLEMVDPGFPRRGDHNPWLQGENLLFDNLFPENCIKIKEILTANLKLTGSILPDNIMSTQLIFIPVCHLETSRPFISVPPPFFTLYGHASHKFPIIYGIKAKIS